MSREADVARLAESVSAQNDALRRGEYRELRAATEATRRLTASLEEGYADGQRLLPHGAASLVRRLRRLLDENARLLAAARGGAAAGAGVGYDAGGRRIGTGKSSALTPRSPKQL